MARATIISDDGEGLYSIRLEFGAELRDARVAQIDRRLAKLNERITDLEELRAPVKAAFDEAVIAQQAVIAQIGPALEAEQDPDADPPPVSSDELLKEASALTVTTSTLRIELDQFTRDISYLDADKRSLDLERRQLMSRPATQTRAAWSTTYTEGMTGEQAIAEVPGVPDLVLLRGTSAGPPEGQLVTGGFQSPEQIFWNGALAPAFMKWKPTYRIGTITSLDDDSCNVALDPQFEDGLNINQTSSLSNVPIKYGTCDGAAFISGDRVLVAFPNQDWNSPRVVGFESNPRRCGLITFTGHAAFAGYTAGARAGLARFTFVVNNSGMGDRLHRPQDFRSGGYLTSDEAMIIRVTMGGWDRVLNAATTDNNGVTSWEAGNDNVTTELLVFHEYQGQRVATCNEEYIAELIYFPLSGEDPNVTVSFQRDNGDGTFYTYAEFTITGDWSYASPGNRFTNSGGDSYYARPCSIDSAIKAQVIGGQTFSIDGDNFNIAPSATSWMARV